MKFYKLEYDDNNYEGDGTQVGDSRMHIGACPKYGRKHPFIWKRREGEKGNLIINLPSLKIGDFLQIWGGYWIITERTAKLLKEQGFSGYELRHVKVNEVKKMKKGQTIPNLWELVVTGWGGIAPSESEMKRIYECEACVYWKYTGLSNASALINLAQWDSSDFFKIFPLMGYIFVTERVKQFVEENGLKGCIFRELRDLRTVGEIIGSGVDALSLEMPKARAKEIGEPLGLYWELPVKGTSEYKAMREALLKAYKEIYTSGERIVYLEDEDGYLIEPKFD